MVYLRSMKQLNETETKHDQLVRGEKEKKVDKRDSCLKRAEGGGLKCGAAN